MKKQTIMPPSKILLGTTSNIQSIYINNNQITALIGIISKETFQKYQFENKMLGMGIKPSNIYCADCGEDAKTISNGVLDGAIRFIQVKAEEGNVLIYSQSTSYLARVVLIGFLMKSQKQSFERAHKIVNKQYGKMNLSEQHESLLNQYGTLLGLKQATVQQIPDPQIPFDYQIKETDFCHHIISINDPATIEKGNLFLGSSVAVRKQNLANNQINAILTLLTIQAYKTLQIKQLCQINKISHKFINIKDSPDERLSEHFSDCFEFIEQNLRERNVLVHCKAGRSRSASIVIGYLIFKFNVTYQTALQFVIQKRPVICPNQGFDDILYQLSKKNSS